MDAIDLAVVTRHPETWSAVQAIFGTCLPRDPEPDIDPPADACIGILRPDFGPGYRVLLVRLGDSPRTLPALLARHRPPYTVALGLACGLPGKHLDIGDVVIAKAIPGFEWSARVGRGAGSGAEPEAPVDNNLLRGALGLDAVDQRWTRQTRVARPGGARAPRLMAGEVASTTTPITDWTVFDADRLRAIARRWPKLVAVEREGLDIARALGGGGDRFRGALLTGITGALPEGEPGDAPPHVGYAAANAASFLHHWIRHAWPTRPVSAATGQTPKGVRLGDEAVARRSHTDTLPQVERVRTEPPPAPRTRSGPLDLTVRPIEGRPPPVPRRDSGPLPGVERTTTGPLSLRAQLARLYPTADETRRVLAEAGLSVEVDPSGGADVRWYRILESARHVPGAMERLLAVLVRHGH